MLMLTLKLLHKLELLLREKHNKQLNNLLKLLLIKLLLSRVKEKPQFQKVLRQLKTLGKVLKVPLKSTEMFRRMPMLMLECQLITLRDKLWSKYQANQRKTSLLLNSKTSVLSVTNEIIVNV
jgi:hypothetical protein